MDKHCEILKINKGQIWVETVIYTLIGLVLIGVSLAVVTPFIQEKIDQKMVDSSVQILNQIDNSIANVKNFGPGNKREVVLDIKEGRLNIDPETNKFTFEIEDSNYAASEFSRGEAASPILISGTNLKIKTVERGEDSYNIEIMLDLDPNIFDLKLNDEEEKGTFNKAANPYRILVENKGKCVLLASDPLCDSPDEAGLIKINIQEI